MLSPSIFSPQQFLDRGNMEIWIGVLFIFGGLTVLALNTKITFSCHRSITEENTCQLTSSGIMGCKTTRIPLENLRNAEVETSLGTDYDTVYRVVLLTKTGKIPLNKVWTTFNYDLKQKNAKKINDFLENQTKQSLLVEEQPSWSMYFLGGVFILVGMIVALQ
jgi:hypothetical protein